MNSTMTTPYPLNAFHHVVRQAAEEVQHHVQAPDALVGMAFLTTLSVACQGLIDVRLPSGQIRPVSLNLLTIADSGERKSGVDSLVSAPIHAFDEATEHQHDLDRKTHAVRYQFWKAGHSGLQRKIARLAQQGTLDDALYEELAKHADQAPAAPRMRRIMRHNATERALMEALSGTGEAIAFMCDEGDVILRGGAMRQLGLLNKVWDGTRLLTFDRAHGRSLVARHPRMTVGIMVQQSVLQTYLDRQGDMARGSGHWARYLVGWPTSTQGMRYMSYVDPSWVHLPKFHRRVAALLDTSGRQKGAGHLERTVIELSDDAKVRWVDMLNTTETMVQPWGELRDIRDFAAKAMEQVARVAALFHWFSEQAGTLSVDTLERSLRIVKWHLYEFKRIFSPQCIVPKAQLDAETLERYLHAHYWCRGFTVAPKNSVLHDGPLRPVQRLDAALDHLCASNRTRIEADAKRKRYVQLNPQYFDTLPRLINLS